MDKGYSTNTDKERNRQLQHLDFSGARVERLVELHVLVLHLVWHSARHTAVRRQRESEHAQLSSDGADVIAHSER